MDLRLLAGTPNDTNRDYVPMEIKGSDMTVNENGNNSQVYPTRLRECRGILVDNVEDVWYEYIPESYDGSKKVPLVISNHGGQMNGWAQAVYSSWTLLSEKEGFICVFPNAHELMMWTVQGMAEKVRANPNLVLPIPIDPVDYRDNHDLKFLNALIREMQQTYEIDNGRIFMQGMSMGHMMTDQFARYFGNILAGAAGAGAGPMASQLYDSEGNLLNIGGPTPMWISHPEKNGMDGPLGDEQAAQIAARTYWSKVNGICTLPKIRIIGEDNFAFFTGEKADLVYLDIKNRDHGQALDESFYYWNYLFSGLRRADDGSILKTTPHCPMDGDQFALSFACNTSKAWVNGQIETMSLPALYWQKLKYHGLDGGQLVRGEYLCVSLRFLAHAFGAKYTTDASGTEATLHLADGRVVKCSRGVIGCLVDNNLYSMYCETLYRNGELLVSVEWFCRFLFNLTVTSCAGVVYVTDHFAELSTFMAEILKEILK